MEWKTKYISLLIISLTEHICHYVLFHLCVLFFLQIKEIQSDENLMHLPTSCLCNVFHINRFIQSAFTYTFYQQRKTKNAGFFFPGANFKKVRIQIIVLCLRHEVAGGILFSGCPSVRPYIRPSIPFICVSLTRYLKNHLTDRHQT